MATDCGSGIPEVKDDLCEYCFDILHARWANTKYPTLPNGYDPKLRTALFVTFNEYYDPPGSTWASTNSSPSSKAKGNPVSTQTEVSSDASTAEPREERLRGCIGCLDADKLTLAPGLQNYCCSAAFKDGRFAPIRKDEMPNLTCTVSLLHSFDTAEHSYDWEVGVHGVIVDFWDRSGREYSATYLPEIAAECGMTRERAIYELCRKAGYNGVVDESVTCRSNMKVTRYQSSRVKLSGQDYYARRN